MKVSEAIEILKTLDPDKELITAWYQNSSQEWLINSSGTNIDHEYFTKNKEFFKFWKLNPDKVVIIS